MQLYMIILSLVALGFNLLLPSFTICATGDEIPLPVEVAVSELEKNAKQVLESAEIVSKAYETAKKAIEEASQQIQVAQAAIGQTPKAFANIQGDEDQDNLEMGVNKQESLISDTGISNSVKQPSPDNMGQVLESAVDHKANEKIDSSENFLNNGIDEEVIQEAIEPDDNASDSFLKPDSVGEQKNNLSADSVEDVKDQKSNALGVDAITEHENSAIKKASLIDTNKNEENNEEINNQKNLPPLDVIQPDAAVIQKEEGFDDNQVENVENNDDLSIKNANSVNSNADNNQEIEQVKKPAADENKESKDISVEDKNESGIALLDEKKVDDADSNDNKILETGNTIDVMSVDESSLDSGGQAAENVASINMINDGQDHLFFFEDSIKVV